MSEKSQVKKLEESFKELIAVIFNIHDDAYGKTPQSQQNWMTRTQKFNSVFIKGWEDDHELFFTIFLSFFIKYKKDIASYILIDEEENGEINTKVNDAWIKDLTELSIQNSQNSFSTKLRNRGKVIFFEENNPKRTSISIPINEIYNVAVDLFRKKGEKYPKFQAYPPQLLKSLYSVFYNCLPDDVFEQEKEVLLKNITDLNELIEEYSPISTTRSSNVGSGADGITSIIDKIVSSANLGDSIDSNTIMKTIGDYVNNNENTLGKAGVVIQKVMETVKGDYDQEKGISSVISGIGKSFQDPDIVSAISEVTSFGSNQRAELQATIPSVSTVTDDNLFDASIQD